MYQALYRQYRPKTFEELLGQNHITTTLRHQVEKGSIGHAYLFSGTRGTGKTSAAKILSRAVNCLNPHNGNPCNTCEICKGILDESIMDVIEMDAASNNSVEDVRDLRDKVIYPPSRAKYKVYIIDEVHMLSKGAFNALLKTLEEPPKHLIFILATTEPERLPQTILSRCQRFDFKRITTENIIENMRGIINNLNIEVEDKVLNLIARNSDGAMRDALSLLDQCVSFTDGKIAYKEAIEILGIANLDMVFNMVSDIKDNNFETTLMTIDNIIQDGKDIHQFIKDIIIHYRNLMISKTSKSPMDIIETDEETLNKYLEQSRDMSLSYILKALEILTNAEAQAKWSTEPRIVLEMAVVKLLNLEEEQSLEERIKRLEMGIRVEAPKETVKNTIKHEKEPIKVPVKNQVQKKENIKEEVSQNIELTDNGTDLSLETIKKEWQKIMQTIKSKKINIYALMIEGEVLSFSNSLLTIGYKEGFGFHKEAVSSPNNKEFIEQVLSNYFNKNIAVSFIMADNKPKEIKPQRDNKDDAIKKVIDFFGEDIVEIK